MSKTILVVDDERHLVSLVEKYLLKEGYRVVTAYNGQDALNVARHEKPDLIILDIMMPVMDGYEFIRNWRKDNETPIILLTAKVEDDEKVIGLELGSDDYITKPFHPRELIARVRAVLRRTSPKEDAPRVINAGDISLDRDYHTVQVNNRPVDLTPSEFELLAKLMSAPGRVYSRLELLEALEGISYEGYQRTIDLHVKNLRYKIEPEPHTPKYIETVYGVGYRFIKG
jgi:DNA-binding response OmpR family regulator